MPLAQVKPAAAQRGTVEQTYQKLTQRAHILQRPDTYVGSVEAVTQDGWVFDAAAGRMAQRKLTYVPGLYKIFDEILVNAADNKQRDTSMSEIRVEIDAAAGRISVQNNGKGVPVVMHQEHGIYVPELIFGHLLTSSNYNDNQKKVVGGRNGYERRVGRFEAPGVRDADLQLRQFSDLPRALDDGALDKAETILMYCTGGVRCERASAYLRSRGVTGDLCQLSGGIHRYQERYGNGGFFRGRCYVFDPRMAVGAPAVRGIRIHHPRYDTI
mgnify:CR=1 FL=1